MKIYYSDIRGIDPALALYPPQSASRASALGTSLLAAAYEDYAKIRMPKILQKLTGRPIFADGPSLHFSISHSRTHVLCAISQAPVGVDTLDHRPVRQSTIDALAQPEELAGLSFHELWSLRESFFKLTGEGDLKAMRFFKQGGVISGPRGDVYFKLYPDIESSSCAIAAYDDCFPDKLIKIPADKLLKKGKLT